MPIRFRCGQCQQLLSISRRKQGAPIVCPQCSRPLQVPHSSEEGIPAGETSWAQRAVALALGGGILLLVAYLAWAWPRGQEPAAGEQQAKATEAPAELSTMPPSPAATEKAAATPSSEPSPEHPVPKPAPARVEVSLPQADPPAAKPALPPERGASSPAPEPPVARASPATKPVVLKRLDERSAEDLRKELLLVPELALDDVPGTSEALTRIAQQLLRSNGVYPGPLLLERQRADLAALPLSMGMDCQLGVEPASALQALSRKLRTVLQGCISSSSGDPRPDPDQLRAALLGKDPGTPQQWLQADAVPALMQLLQAEDRQVRRVLVEVLSRIKSERATQALAIRAMTDLDPDVRALAVQELANRPHRDYRDLLVTGLRYPWLPVEEHAAEALIAVKDRDAVPPLVALLDLPDPRQPTTLPLGRARKLVVPEMVRVNHLRNCLLCHAPSLDPNDLVRGAIPTPGKPLPGPATTPAYYGGSKSFVRADITYLRQDFSVVQPTPNAGVWPTQERFDYMVRMRSPTPQESKLARTTKQTPGPSQEVILFTLRELTGKDLGLTSKEWKAVVPEDSLTQVQQARQQKSESPAGGDWKQFRGVDPAGNEPGIDTRVQDLRNELLTAAPEKRDTVLAQLREGKGVIYTTALALAIKDLEWLPAIQARDALVVRLTRLPESTLRHKLRDDNAEVRQAAARACGRKMAEAFIPDLIALLDDSDANVVQAARSALKTLTDRDEGPEANATPEQRRTAAQAWQTWWQRQIRPGKKS